MFTLQPTKKSQLMTQLYIKATETVRLVRSVGVQIQHNPQSLVNSNLSRDQQLIQEIVSEAGQMKTVL